MTSVVVTNDTGVRTPLLHSSLPTVAGDDEIVPLSSPPPNGLNGSSLIPPNKVTDHKQRLVSLDVFRGLTIALMILVDDAGGTFSSINHSPWFGVTLADFVMPFFLFSVGLSVALVFKRVSSKLEATKKVILRTVKLFLLGVILQGGFFHGRNDLTYGVDVGKIRWMGVLQRISIGYLLTSISEIWLVDNAVVDSGVAFAKKYSTQGVVAVLIGSLYMSLLYGLYVPSWTFEVLSMNSTLNGSSTQIWHLDPQEDAVGEPENKCLRMRDYRALALVKSSLLLNNFRLFSEIFVVLGLLAVRIVLYSNKHEGALHYAEVLCGVRGSLEPPCNAVGLIDRFFLGEQHLYKRPVYRRTQECSVSSPDYGPPPPNAPVWCLAPFDPEGLLSSLMAAITCFMGLHYGHIIVHFKGDMQRIILWSVCSLTMLISGYVLKVLGVPFSKPLYTLSYMCLTTGASGLLLTLIFFIVDVKRVRKPMVLFKWMGMNALVVYALAACDLFPAALQGFYLHSPENNLVNITEGVLQAALHSNKFGSLAFVILEILFWCIFSGFLHMKHTYIRL